MRTIIAVCLFSAAVLGMAGTAEAAGCVKGAIVGGVAGHMAGGHGMAGAAAGCAIGHHNAAKKAAAQNTGTQANQPK